MTTPPELPAPLKARLDEYIRRAKIVERRAPHVPAIHDLDPACAWEAEARAALLADLAGLLADRERLDWLDQHGVNINIDGEPSEPTQYGLVGELRSLIDRARAARAIPSTEEDTNG